MPNLLAPEKVYTNILKELKSGGKFFKGKNFGEKHCHKYSSLYIAKKAGNSDELVLVGVPGVVTHSFILHGNGKLAFDIDSEHGATWDPKTNTYIDSTGQKPKILKRVKIRDVKRDVANLSEAITATIQAGVDDVSQEKREKGLYERERIRFAGIPINIENRAGSFREGTDPDGTPWKSEIHNDYGEICSAMGVDGDMLDVFLGNNQNCDKVWVIHQATMNEWDKYDEDKCMLGFDSKAEAILAYLKHYEFNRKMILDVSEMSMDEFRSFIKECGNSVQLPNLN